jgi:hypothetical protein
VVFYLSPWRQRWTGGGKLTILISDNYFNALLDLKSVATGCLLYNQAQIGSMLTGTIVFPWLLSYLSLSMASRVLHKPTKTRLGLPR